MTNSSVDTTSIPPPRTEVGEVAQANCLRCTEPMVKTKRRDIPGRRHRSRGLCIPCYMAAERAGELDQYSRTNRSRSEVIAAYTAYKEDHPRASISMVARALDMPKSTLSNALIRERAQVGAVAVDDHE